MSTECCGVCYCPDVTTHPGIRINFGLNKKKRAFAAALKRCLMRSKFRLYKRKKFEVARYGRHVESTQTPFPLLREFFIRIRFHHRPYLNHRCLYLSL